jgi:hypothetical protein
MRCLTARLTARCSIRLMSGSDDASPRRPATTGPPEGRPLDKIIRTELTEEAEGENEEAQGEAAGGGAGLPLELPDVSTDDNQASTETELDRMDTPSCGVIHLSDCSLGSTPGAISTASTSPVRDTVGKVHAVAGDLVAT